MRNMRTIVAIRAAIFAALLGPVLSLAAAPPYSGLYVLGDSLSDTGNVKVVYDGVVASLGGVSPVPGVLGMRKGSRLYRRLVRETRIASDVSAYTFDLTKGEVFYLPKDSGPQQIIGSKAGHRDDPENVKRLAEVLKQHRGEPAGAEPAPRSEPDLER